MLNDMEQFVPQEVCLSCDGCCRFKDETSAWRPRIAKEESMEMVALGLATQIFAKSMTDQDGYIKAKPCLGQFHCSFFHKENNTCNAYQARPFECQLYPFVLVRAQENLSVHVHLSCPHIGKMRSSPEFEKYVAYLKGFLQKAHVTAFLRRNRDIGGEYKDYRQELEFLFDLNWS